MFILGSSNVLGQCTYTVPYSGSNSITTCSGTICDHAGTGNYSDNANGYTIIYPGPCNSFVRITGLSSSGESCCDRVVVYNGAGTGAPVLGTYYMNTGIPTLTSTSGPLTIQFISDYSITGAGFSAQISCVGADVTAPTLNSVITNSSCWITDNTHTYTITAQTTDPSGIGGSTYGTLALINYQGGNGGAYGGYVAWNTSLATLNAGGFTADQCEAIGGGFVGKYPSAYGNAALTLIGGTTSLSGNTRTVIFHVRPTTSFPVLAQNDISLYSQDACGNVSGWSNFDLNFSSQTTQAISCPASQTVTCPQVVNYATPTSTCNTTVVRNAGLASGSTFPLGTNSVTYNTYYPNGAGGFFNYAPGATNQQIALAACESVYGVGNCNIGSCGYFTYYKATAHPSCDCAKANGSYEFIYSNTGYTYVGDDYGGTRLDNVAGNQLFTRVKTSGACSNQSWALAQPALGQGGASCSFNVTVNAGAVTLNNPGNQTFTAVAGSCNSSYTIADPLSAACSGGTWGYSMTGATALSASGIADGTSSGALIFNVGTTTVTLTGTAAGVNAANQIFTVTVNPPAIAISGATTICAGQSTTLTANGGSSSSLASVLAAINANSSALIASIPSPSGFNMDAGVNSNYISDGCSDMYDAGNYLNTNLASNISYSDNAVLSSAAFGTGGQYFTRYLGPGGCQAGPATIFYMAADVNGLSFLRTTGNNGADGGGTQDLTNFTVTSNGVTYTCFLKRVYNAGDPSINQLFMIPGPNSASQTMGGSTDDNFHNIANLGGVTRVYYMLYAGANGAFINNAQATSIAQTFANIIPAASTYAWSNGATTASTTVSAAGTYTVTVSNPGSSNVITYNQSFTAGVIPTTQATAWCTFRSQLLGSYNYTSLTVRGSQNPTGITITDPAAILAIANALRTAGTYTGVVGGNTWNVSTGCVAGSSPCGGSPGVVLHINGVSCSCDGAGPWVIRPEINNVNWGGLGTGTCSNFSQNIEVIFGYGQSCSSTAQATLTVNALPSISSVTAATNPICINATTSITANGVGGAGATLTWWTGAGGTGTNLGSANPLTVGPGTYYARVTGTCAPAVESNIIILSKPLSPAPISITASPTTICAGGSTTLTANGALIAHYPFTSNLNDVSGSGLNLSGSGGTITGAGIQLTTGSSYASAFTQILNTDKYTVAFDMRYDANPDGDWRKIFGYEPAGTDRSPGIWKFPLSMQLHWRHDPGNTGLAEGYIYNLNQWYSIVGVKNGTTFSLYVNGVLVESGVVANPKTGGGASLWFGGAPVTLRDFKVYNGDLRWYSGSCGGTYVGSGPTISVSPASNTTYYVRSEGSCDNSNCAALDVIVTPSPVITSTITNESCVLSNNGAIDITLNGGISNVRYVYLKQNKTDGDAFINLAELQAYEIFTGTNVAFSKPVSFNSVHGSGSFPGSELVDNISNDDGNMYHSAGAGSAEWVQVDLGAGYNLDNIRIWNRFGCCWNRSNNFQLILRNTANIPVYSAQIDVYQGTNSQASPVFNVLDVSWSGGGSPLDRVNLDAGSYTLNYADAAGCTSSHTATVSTTPDNTAPTITCPANISVNATAGTCGAVVTYTAPVGTDNCPGATTTRTAGPASGSTFPVGVTTVTHQVTASNGQTASCSFTVTVVDNQAPTITCPANISVNASRHLWSGGYLHGSSGHG
ncbi:MAG: HYR domain-containing protein [Bacteroidetes bacterium]|nr:HYR domain-containing protein [Bacteroidota bacterium]